VKIDKPFLHKLRPQIEAALKSVHPDLSFHLGACKFNSGKATFALEVISQDVVDPNLAGATRIDGLDLDKVATWATNGGLKWKLYTYNAKRPRWCYAIREVDKGTVLNIDSRTAKLFFAESV
jgi:hypothetical protein